MPSNVLYVGGPFWLPLSIKRELSSLQSDIASATRFWHVPRALKEGRFFGKGQKK
jgi:hypothetical protein